MSRVALLCSEPIRAAMGGIGVRYMEMARHLSEHGFEVTLVSPASPQETAAAGLAGVRIERYAAHRRDDWLAGCAAVVAQGQLANDLVLADPGLPLVFDLYDPWLIENLAYAPDLGDEAFRNDYRAWKLQLGRGDLLLCASEEQRLFYLGFLTALGRIDARRTQFDASLSRLVAVVPFGCTVTNERALRPPSGEGRILFGGIYDWYDIDTLLAALERLQAPRWRLSVVRSALPEATPQRELGRLEAACRRRGWWGERVVAIDRVPAANRCDLFAQSDLLVAPHRSSLESDLSFRTRFLDALAVGCPIVATRGGALSRIVASRCAGWIVPEEDVQALAMQIDAVLAGGEQVDARRRAGLELAAESSWPRALAPLVDFLRRPGADKARAESIDPPAPAARESAAQRLWRRARRRLPR